MRIDQRTVDAQHHGLLTQLLNQSALVPWDARAALNGTVDDLSETMVREHLGACGSALLEEPDARTIYRKMDIVRRVNAHEVPRNVALLFFARDPARWFPGAKIEVAILRTGTGGDVIEEKEFGGGLAEQVSDCLAYLRREVISLEIRKSPDRWQASHRANYPEEALREVLVNALFHRGYDRDSPHTTLVRVTSDRIDVRSTPGPVQGIDRDQFRRGTTPRLVPPRNPRIGELFKDADVAARFFDVAGPAILDDPRALLESAQNKLWLAGRAHRAGHSSENRVLLADAKVLLERVIGMDTPRRRYAWAWRELGRTRRWLGEPDSTVDEAYAKAIELAPDEAKFREERG